VRLVQVHVVGAQPPQRAVDRLQDVLAGQAGVVRPLRPGGEVDLGEDLQRLPPLPGQCGPEHLLGAGVGVGVGGVEGGDTGVQGSLHAPGGGLVLHLGAVREPVTVGDLADLQAGAAEVSKAHGVILRAGRARLRCRPAQPGNSPRFTWGLGSRVRRIWNTRIATYITDPLRAPSPNFSIALRRTRYPRMIASISAMNITMYRLKNAPVATWGGIGRNAANSMITTISSANGMNTSPRLHRAST